MTEALVTVACLTVLLVAIYGLAHVFYEAAVKPHAQDMMRRQNALEERRQALAERQQSRCEICSGKAVYLCPTCRVPIQDHSHEADFICQEHGFISPIRQHDGAQVIGDGQCGELKFIARRDRLKAALQ